MKIDTRHENIRKIHATGVHQPKGKTLAPTLTRHTGFYFTIFFLLLGLISSAQIKNDKSNIDSSSIISKASFNNLVDSCLKLLQTKKLSEISDKEHINIMMCLNTILVRHFVGGDYAKLTKVSIDKNYAKAILKIYPNWIPNRGLGFYFKKLKMELYGTPRAYAIFNVVEY